MQTGVADRGAAARAAGRDREAKGVEETEWQIFLRAVGCNWLVCLAVWMALAAEDVAGKILAIFFPIMAFVAMGFDHVVANMFFLPAAIFAGVAGHHLGDAIHNWIFAFLGNLVGAAVFVAGAYWYLYGRDTRPSRGHAGGRPFERSAGRERVSVERHARRPGRPLVADFARYRADEPVSLAGLRHRGHRRPDPEDAEPSSRR